MNKYWGRSLRMMGTPAGGRARFQWNIGFHNGPFIVSIQNDTQWKLAWSQTHRCYIYLILYSPMRNMNIYRLKISHLYTIRVSEVGYFLIRPQLCSLTWSEECVLSMEMFNDVSNPTGECEERLFDGNMLKSAFQSYWELPCTCETADCTGNAFFI